MEGRVDVGDWLHAVPRWFTRSQTVSHPSTNLAVHGRKSDSLSVDRKSYALTTYTTLPSTMATKKYGSGTRLFTVYCLTLIIEG